MYDAMCASEDNQMKRQHIFAVNGSSDFLDVIRELFQDEEYNVTTTNFVPETFDLIATLKPELLMVDLVIGQHAGWDLLEHISAEAQTNGIPLIIVSTSDQILDDAQADHARYGGDLFIRKPFDLEDILAAVRKLIGTA